MKKLLKLFIVATILVGVSISGCKKSKDEGPDVDKPSVEITKPKSNETFLKGSPMELDAMFRDNRALKQCTITIRYNEKGGKAKLKGIGDPWTPAAKGSGIKHEILFSGETEKRETIAQLFKQNIESACLGGSYTLSFVVEDEAGNVTDPIEVDINIAE